MGESFEEVTKAALRLTEQERVLLAESLLLTVDEGQSPLVDEKALREFERRLLELKKGRVTGIPSEQVLREIDAALSAKA